MKPGIKTSELAVTLIGVLGGIILSCINVDNQITQCLGILLASICGGSYTMGRSMVKSKEALGQAQVEAPRLMSKKD